MTMVEQGSPNLKDRPACRKGLVRVHGPARNEPNGLPKRCSWPGAKRTQWPPETMFLARRETNPMASRNDVPGPARNEPNGLPTHRLAHPNLERLACETNPTGKIGSSATGTRPATTGGIRGSTEPVPALRNEPNWQKKASLPDSQPQRSALRNEPNGTTGKQGRAVHQRETKPTRFPNVPPKFMKMNKLCPAWQTSRLDGSDPGRTRLMHLRHPSTRVSPPLHSGTPGPMAASKGGRRVPTPRFPFDRSRRRFRCVPIRSFWR